MKCFSILTFFILLVLFTNCQNAEKPTVQEPTFPEKEIKKVKAKYKIAIIPGPSIENEKTMVPSTDIFLTSPQFPEAVKLITDYNYNELEKEDWKKLDIPPNAAFAFMAWYAGGGTNYYGLVNGSTVKLYQQILEEGNPEEDFPTPPFQLTKTIDLDRRKVKTGHFICFNNDESSTLKLSIHFNDQGKATALKHKGQNDYIPLQFHTNNFSSEAIIPKSEDQYFEIYDGKKNGDLTITHSGNYDYVRYIRLKDQKVFNFTIDHDATVVQGSYRKTPCF